ncbi:MAG: hypothetical protein BWY92_01448 [Firmicutes bacterium ADurb.BinA052]|nr:MAG: hypothetical protein BWY92_01448 [Firmicutes bacterium ADurb.BinA052]
MHTGRAPGPPLAHPQVPAAAPNAGIGRYGKIPHVRFVHHGVCRCRQRGAHVIRPSRRVSRRKVNHNAATPIHCEGACVRIDCLLHRAAVEHPVRVAQPREIPADDGQPRPIAVRAHRHFPPLGGLRRRVQHDRHAQSRGREHAERRGILRVDCAEIVAWIVQLEQLLTTHCNDRARFKAHLWRQPPHQTAL